MYSSLRNVFDSSVVHVFSVFIFQIGAAYQMSNVSLYVVDLKRVQPFMMNTPRVTTVVNTGVNDLPKTSGMWDFYTETEGWTLQWNQFWDYWSSKNCHFGGS